MNRKLFSPEDLTRIREAVQEAEAKTSGEIVPYIVEQSDFYEEAVWRCMGFFTFFALASLFFLHHFSDLWFPVGVRQLSLITMAAGGIGAVATLFFPTLRRFFAGDTLLERRVRARALEAFVSEEVFNTRDRTGILIFISLLEHRVIVLGDSGINAKVDPREWDHIVELIVSGIKRGAAVDGLVQAISECGRLLERHGVMRRPDDRDELSDELRIGGTP